jgi:UPF0755 protein
LRSFFRFILVILLLAIATGAVGAWYVLNQFEAPGPQAMEGEASTIVSLPMGTGLNQAARILQERGVIKSGLIFRAGVMYNRKAAALKAGEYEIPSGASPHEIMTILIDGKSIVYKLTLAEGLTSAMIVDLVRKDPTLTGEIAEIPPEGSLLPETYIFNRGETRASLIKRMRDDHARVVDELWAGRAQNLPIATKEEAVILASIVEKETGVASERPRVASVFVNRLRKGMKLQSDPTIIYGITKGVPLGRGIRQSELQGATPYNTYVIMGLPPTPIANPGRESLAAVMNPAQTEDLYFVADGTGGHAFATTLAEHERNVKNWREIEKQRAASAAGTPTP